MQQQIHPQPNILNSYQDSSLTLSDTHYSRSPFQTGSSQPSASTSSPIQPPFSLTYSLLAHNPHILTNSGHMNGIRNNIINLENAFHTKLGGIESKLTNMDVELAIWKKTFSWKIDEMNLRVRFSL